MLRYSIPVVLFFVLGIFLYLGLVDSKKDELPSTLINKPVPIFTLPTVMDPSTALTNKNLLGHVSLFNIWATWCYSCQAEHSTLMEIANSHQVVIYGLDYKDDLATAQNWLKQQGNPYQLSAFDADGLMAINWGVYGTPETYIIDKKGIIRFRFIGAISPEDWKDTLLPVVMKLQKEAA